MGRYGNRLLMAAAGGGGVVRTPTYVQGQRSYVYGAPVTAGNFLIAANLAYPDTAKATGCTDSVNGAGWTQFGSAVSLSSAGTLTLWYYANTKAGTPTLTYTYSGSPTSYGYTSAEYKNVAAPDVIASGSGTGTALSAGPTGTLAGDGELVIGTGFQSTGSTVTLTPASGYTLHYGSDATYPTFWMDMVDSGTAGVTASLTSSVSAGWVMFTATFKPA